MQNYALLTDEETFAFSAENPTGAREGGSRGGDCTKLSPTVTIRPGETAVLADTEGPGVIRNMWFTGRVSHDLILRIFWDGQGYPSVEAPLSAFFGCAYDEDLTDRDGRYPVLNSAVMLVAPGRGCNCFFEMPYRKRCLITMENRGDRDEALYYIITGGRCAVPENAGYFHASYRQEHPVTRGRSYTVIDGIRGKGQFLGVTLAAGINGNNTCWVEGEARMYMDGDRWPSIHYTGTEDYFTGSYAFGNDVGPHCYQTFSGCYSGMFAVLGHDREPYRGQQRFLLYRFHVPDPIRFTESFRMTLDDLGWTGPRYDDFTSVAYWYQALPGAKLKELPDKKDMCMR